MKVYKLNATANDVIYNGVKTKCIEIFAFANGEDDCTIAYELTGDEEKMFVYNGAVNTEDPGEGPMEEYETREEAIQSEYGNLFGTVFTLADSMK